MTGGAGSLRKVVARGGPLRSLRVQSPAQHGQHALKTPLGGGLRRAAAQGVRPLQQQRALLGREVAQRQALRHGQTRAAQRVEVRFALERAVAVPPVVDRAVLQRAVLVQHALLAQAQRHAQAAALGACARARVEREVCARQLVHARAAHRAVHERAKFVSVALRRLPAGVRVDHCPAVRAGAPVQLLKEHAQVRVDAGDRARRGARALAVGALQDAQRGRRARDAVDRWTPDALHAHRLQVLALALLKEQVHRQRRLARAGHARERDEAAAGDVDVHVLQIALARAADADGPCGSRPRR